MGKALFINYCQKKLLVVSVSGLVRVTFRRGVSIHGGGRDPPPRTGKFECAIMMLLNYTDHLTANPLASCCLALGRRNLREVLIAGKVEPRHYQARLHPQLSTPFQPSPTGRTWPDNPRLTRAGCGSRGSGGGGGRRRAAERPWRRRKPPGRRPDRRWRRPLGGRP